MGLDNPLHIAFLLVVLLLVFGAKRLPEMGRSLGSGLRGFKETVSGADAPAQLPQAALADTAPLAAAGVDVSAAAQPGLAETRTARPSVPSAAL